MSSTGVAARTLWTLENAPDPQPSPREQIGHMVPYRLLGP
jgi:hypothetical protein